MSSPGRPKVAVVGVGKSVAYRTNDGANPIDVLPLADPIRRNLGHIRLFPPAQTFLDGLRARQVPDRLRPHLAHCRDDFGQGRATHLLHHNVVDVFGLVGAVNAHNVRMVLGAELPLPQETPLSIP